MAIDLKQIEATTQRYNQRERYRNRNERLIKERRYLEVDSPKRVEMFLKRRDIDFQQAVEVMRSPTTAEAETITAATDGATASVAEPSALERVLGTNNLMGVAFLERGLQVARSVARIWVAVNAAGRPSGYGTGFMISPQLLLTNNHVLESPSVARRSFVEFDYQIGLNGKFLPTITFDLDPDTFFFTDEHLDYSVVAIRVDDRNRESLAGFGWNPLIEEEGKAIISQWLNIIQHPNGEPKQLALRENQLVDLLDDFIQYKTDTEPGSSGSAVFNDQWEVVGLHHSGVWEKNAAGQILAVDGSVWHKSMGEHRIKWISNEGIRISKLVKNLRERTMTQTQRRLFDQIFTAAPPSPVTGEIEERTPPAKAVGNQAATVSVAPDGTATWTIPLSVSVKLGGGAEIAAVQQAGQMQQTADKKTAEPIQAADKPTPPATANEPNEILAAAKREIGARADVLNVRLGYVFKNGWITNERALVITVRQKLTNAELGESGIPALPENFMGLPVEVANPTIEQLVALARGPVATEAVFAAPEVLPEEITYAKLPGNLLNQVTARMRVVAHVSPDAGWTKLSEFLGVPSRRLVIGMFDFGAPHVADAVEAAGLNANFNKMTLVMQRGESVGTGTKINDLTDDQAVEKLSDSLGGKFENAWVKTGRVNGWVSSSYHIKVAVRDQRAFWLSSGNWQSSNLPEADPVGENPPRRMWLDKYNREWHAVVENAALAKVFEKYLLHDFQNNLGADGGDETLDLPDLLIPDEFFSPSAEERASQFQYFQPFDENRTFTVTPLLTPDNYHEETLRLIQSAEEELLIQNQTFNAPKDFHHKLRELMDAVIERQRRGVEVKIIFRLMKSADARANLEKLKDYGFDTSVIKVQKNCHTKGIIVDRRWVLLGSQNWSNDGVSVNRDASLLFDDPPLANYFRDIFDHDWNNRARQNIGSERLPIEWIGANETTPAGMVRINWKDYLEML